ncbi:MAG: hypothetical protein K6G00_11215 [Treponema sp.]|nr:hypothetical protein [Treponema sp.]
MSQLDFLAEEITKRYGTVKRARGVFLYTAKGVRLTDMYEEGGRAILGWGGGSAFTQLKNVLSRGITGSFNTDFMPRVGKAIGELLNSKRKAYIFHSKEEAVNVAQAFFDKQWKLWKPWAAESIVWRDIACVIVEPPLPWVGDITILAVKDGVTEPDSLKGVRIAAPVAAAVARSVYDMLAAVQVREEKHWFLYDTVLTKYWTRKGPYLYPKVSKENYNDFILHCLDQELVISPFYDVPSIVPFGVDRGVFTKLKNRSFLCQSSEIH